MNSAPKIVVLGAGGLGSLLGGYLAAAGAQVTLVGRPRHVAAVNARGLRVQGRRDRTIQHNLKAVDSPEACEGDFDFLILSVKAKDTEAALSSAEGLRERTAAFLSVQNGATKDNALTAWVGAEDKVIGAVTILGATLLEPGVVRDHTDPATTTTTYVGTRAGVPDSEPVRVLADLLAASGVGSQLAPDISHVQWEKVGQIALVSAWSASNLGFLPGVSLGDGYADRQAAENLVGLGAEIVEVLGKMGYPVEGFFLPVAKLTTIARTHRDDAIEQIMRSGEAMLAAGRVARTSLHEDLLKGRPTELDEIVLPVLAEAQRLGVPTPVLATSYRIGKAAESLAMTKVGATS